MALPVEPWIADQQPRQPHAAVDWSAWYLTYEEDEGHSPTHNNAAKVFESCLQQLARERNIANAYIGKDEFFAWVEAEPLVRVSPDVFILDDPPPLDEQDSWMMWLPRHNPPRFALEVVSDDWKKDYRDNPLKYDQLGCGELVIFDPHATHRRSRTTKRVLIQVYRRDEAGALRQVYSGDGPAFSSELNAWLVMLKAAGLLTLRIARDAAGKELVPTSWEARDQEEQARQQAERRAALLADKLRALGIDPDLVGS